MAGCTLRRITRQIQYEVDVLTLSNSLSISACIPAYLRFCQSTRNVDRVQAAILKRLLRAHRYSAFGREHDFASINTADQYRARVPLRRYSDFEPYIERIAAGEQKVLTADRVVLFEPTGGSTRGSKLIPYTRALQVEFQNGIKAWIADLFLHDPRLLSGGAYWSISPIASRTQTTAGGIRIGFETDSEYLGGLQRRLAAAVMAVPPWVRHIPDTETWRYVTLLFLLRRHDLALISVWHPSFLALLVEGLRQWGDELAYDLERGMISRRLPAGIRSDFMATPNRARELRTALLSKDPSETHAHLWPRLRLISCWADAGATGDAAYLESSFPQARIQGKGLIATEGFVSLPIEGEVTPALSYRSHFFEFLPVDPAGQVDAASCLAHELDVGKTYAVVLSTSGGLYRYQLEDVIEVVGKRDDCPLLRFVGRQNFVADWFGEKLHEEHVRSALQHIFAKQTVMPRFAMLACEFEPRPGYVLYLEIAAPEEANAGFAVALDGLLQSNFHYKYARTLGQLTEVRIHRVQAGARSYTARCVKEGQRLGDVKPVTLDRRAGWAGYFAALN